MIVTNNLILSHDGVSQRMCKEYWTAKSIANSATMLFKVQISQAKSPRLGAGTSVIAISILSGLLIQPKFWHQCLDTL